MMYDMQFASQRTATHHHLHLAGTLASNRIMVHCFRIGGGKKKFVFNEQEISPLMNPASSQPT
jgi:hypothetical protein